MSVIARVVDDLRPIRRPSRILYAGALFWLISGAVHIGALALDQWQWSGPISFRKPVVFSASIGLLLASVGWVLDRLPDRPRLAGALAWTLLISSTVEVGLITMQTWRGRASHFNVFETGDAVIFAAMGATIGVVSLCLIATLVWSLVWRAKDPLVRLAVVGGLALVMTGLGIGQWIVDLGNEYVAVNRAIPETVTAGAEGVAKFPHAVAFHGIQLFIISAVMLRRGGLKQPAQRDLMHLIVWSYTAALGFASAQTIAGHAPLTLTPWSVGLIVAVGVTVLGFTRITSRLRMPAAQDQEPVAPVA